MTISRRRSAIMVGGCSLTRSQLMKGQDPGKRRTKRHFVMAMMLGTALSAAGAATADAAIPAGAVQDLSRYCTACWRNAGLPVDRWGDCTQEVFRRLLERVPGEEWSGLLDAEGPERRELIRAIDAVKKQTQRAA